MCHHQAYIGDIVAVGLEFENGPCLELSHSMNDPMQANISLKG
ncbi:TPA: hypothetical protein ACHYVQ_002284 [Salmonella enterica]